MCYIGVIEESAKKIWKPQRRAEIRYPTWIVSQRRNSFIKMSECCNVVLIDHLIQTEG